MEKKETLKKYTKRQLMDLIYALNCAMEAYESNHQRAIKRSEEMEVEAHTSSVYNRPFIYRR
jgi:hypothetical protein